MDAVREVRPAAAANSDEPATMTRAQALALARKIVASSYEATFDLQVERLRLYGATEEEVAAAVERMNAYHAELIENGLPALMERMGEAVH